MTGMIGEEPPDAGFIHARGQIANWNDELIYKPDPYWEDNEYETDRKLVWGD
jgi:hypothetical protein